MLFKLSQRILNLVLIATAFGQLSGCSKKAMTVRPREAGVGQAAMGVILRQPTSEQIELLNLTEGVTLRGLYGGDVEVFGLKKENLSDLIPEATLQQNIYFDHLFSPPKVTSDFSKLDEAPEATTFDPQKCQKLANPPVAKMNALTLAEQLKRTGIIDLDDGVLRLTSQNSAPGISTSTPLEVLWNVRGPYASKYESLDTQEKTIELTPDELGKYTVWLTVKDERYSCSTIRFSFGVTHNEAYLGYTEPSRHLTEKGFNFFAHLGVIGAPEAWNVSRGHGVKIAILDTGVNYNHPDLRPNILLNEKETPDNGIDDDHNGLVDDIYGWDFSRNDNMPFDDNQHGTHVAGLAASSLSGVAPEAQIIPIKIMNALGGGDLASIEQGIRYAVDQGANIINMSLEGEHKDLPQEYASAVAYAEEHNVLVVVAAGNGDSNGMGFDIDQRPVWPAAMPNKNILSVAATKLKGGLTKYSNFGMSGVDVAAPGGDHEDGLLYAPYYSFQKDMYVGLSGTSMATPVTSGVAALVLAANPDFSATEIKARIMSTVDVSDALKGKVASGGQVSALRAVSPESPQNPAPLTNLQ